MWIGKGGPYHGMNMAPDDVVAELRDDDPDQPVLSTIYGRDAIDGWAIRTLTDYLRTLSRDLHLVIVGSIPETGWSVRVYARSTILTAGDAPSIAEAADKCREAMG